MISADEVRNFFDEHDTMTRREFEKLFHEISEHRAKRSCMNRFVTCRECDTEINSDYAQVDFETGLYTCFDCLDVSSIRLGKTEQAIMDLLQEYAIRDNRPQDYLLCTDMGRVMKKVNRKTYPWGSIRRLKEKGLIHEDVYDKYGWNKYTITLKGRKLLGIF